MTSSSKKHTNLKITKFFDPKTKRLIFQKASATPDFWDAQWDQPHFKQAVEQGIDSDPLVKNHTLKFFPHPSKNIKILEAGCGTGKFVFGLDKLGFSAHGVDLASDTISRTKKLFPHLQLQVADVKKLPFLDAHFDAIWSLGVIEHFWDGFDEILSEAQRVLKPKGILFLTFPHMSPLRKLKVKLGFFPKPDHTFDQSKFFQFALNSSQVKKSLQTHHFKIISQKPLCGFAGLFSEGFIPDSLWHSSHIFSRILKVTIDFISTPFSSHAILLIAQKS